MVPQREESESSEGRAEQNKGAPTIRGCSRRQRSGAQLGGRVQSPRKAAPLLQLVPSYSVAWQEGFVRRKRPRVNLPHGHAVPR